jgi:hypothetical protein
MNAAPPLLAATSVGSLSLVGMAIGAFYRRKFGQGTRSWLLGAGAALGILGGALEAVPGFPGDLVELAGAALLGTGTFWLWFVMLGPRK